ncbi:MAG TPA: L,D-transpeptidase [Chthoniobacterales bacterium]
MKKSAPLSIHVSVAKQQLTVKRGRKVERTFPISTSKFGLGSEAGSFKTPTGRFRIAEKIGVGLPIETAFKSRKPVELTPEMLREDDLIMSRILWLDGLDEQNANTRDRYIYIHGTNQEEELGRPASHGCIRMHKTDVAELCDLMDVNAKVLIAEDKSLGRKKKKARKALRRQSDLPK